MKYNQRITDVLNVIEAMRADNQLANSVNDLVQVATAALKKGNKILLAGNGGSAADCQHIAGELISRFMFDRDALPAIALTTDTSVLTAIGNDYGFKDVFARQIKGLGETGDVLLVYSTSGNSENIIEALKAAALKGISTALLTGNRNGKANSYAQICIEIPSDQTPRIQEGHLIVGHYICEMIELHIFGN